MEYKMNNQTLINALVKAQEKIDHVVNDAKNPYFKSNYASLKNVLDAVKKPLNDEGIYLQQISHHSDTGVIVETIFLGHGGAVSSGQVYIPAQKNDPQAFGSALSYAKRYSVQMACGIASADEDDDAEKAMRRNVKYTFANAEGEILAEATDPTKYLNLLSKHLPSENPDTDQINLYEVNKKNIKEAKKDTRVKKFIESYDRLIEVYEQ